MRMSMRTTSGRVSAHQRRSPAAPSLGLAHDLDVVLGVEEHPEAGADQGLVVGEDDPDHASPLRRPQAGGRRATGSQARRKPPPGGDRPRRVPPEREAARSRMPARPWPPGPPSTLAEAPRPSSSIAHGQAVADAVHQHRGPAGPAWRITLVSDSCTMR